MQKFTPVSTLLTTLDAMFSYRHYFTKCGTGTYLRPGTRTDPQTIKQLNQLNKRFKINSSPSVFINIFSDNFHVKDGMQPIFSPAYCNYAYTENSVGLLTFIPDVPFFPLPPFSPPSLPSLRFPGFAVSHPCFFLMCRLLQ
jgi:hypothetical protein